MFIKYWENRNNGNKHMLNEDSRANLISASEIVRAGGIKIKNEIYRKQGTELVFYNVEDAINARGKLKNFRTSIRDNSVFVYSGS